MIDCQNLRHLFKILTMLRINLRNLREKKGYTQTRMAKLLGIGRSTYISYEKGKSEPSASVLLKIAHYHEVSVDGLLTKDLIAPLFNKQIKTDNILSDDIRILPITISKEQKQNIEFIPAKAIAGYVEGMKSCLLYTSPRPRDKRQSRMPSSA